MPGQMGTFILKHYAKELPRKKFSKNQNKLFFYASVMDFSLNYSRYKLKIFNAMRRCLIYIRFCASDKLSVLQPMLKTMALSASCVRIVITLRCFIYESTVQYNSQLRPIVRIFIQSLFSLDDMSTCQCLHSNTA